MGAPYQSTAISGYNASPPPDDGTTVAANKITWNSTIKTKLTDPLNTFIAAVNSQLVTWSDFSSVTTSTNLSTTTAHHMQTIEVTSGSPTISLGDAATMTKNYVVTVTNTGTGAPVIALATAGNTLDGTAAGTFTFPTGTKTSFTFKVNNGATGYYTEGIGGNKGALTLVSTLTAPTSVVTSTVNAGVAGNLTLQSVGGADVVFDLGSGRALPLLDNQNFLGHPTKRWQTLYTPIIDSGTTGSLSLKTNNGTVGLQILDISSGARNVTIASSAAGNPTISTTAGSLTLGTAIVGASGTVNLAGASSGTGTGIAFPASQSASSDANTLDDYEEGTWVPSVGGNASYTTQTGTYTKIGRSVFIQGVLSINVLGTGSATVISGLPFTVAQNAYIGVTQYGSLSSNFVYVSLEANSGASTLTIRTMLAAGVSDAANNQFVSGSNLVFSGCYQV